jgi:CTP synthase
MVKYIFVLGGVISELGKGVTSPAISRILKELGYRVNIKKLDPHLNIDPGTMNPIERGEVYVTMCGTEVDLDIGHYERIGGIECNKNNTSFC